MNAKHLFLLLTLASFITSNQFESLLQHIDKSKVAIGLYYSSSGRMAKLSLRTFNILKEERYPESLEIAFFELDVDQQKLPELEYTHDTVFIYLSNEVKVLEKQLTLEAAKSFLTETLTSKLIELTEVSTISEEISANDYIVIFVGTESSPNYPKFHYLSLLKYSEKYFITNLEEVKEKYSISDGDAIVLKNFDELKNTLIGEFTQETLINFVFNSIHPNVTQFKEKTMLTMYEHEIPGLFLLANGDTGFEDDFYNLAKTTEDIMFIRMGDSKKHEIGLLTNLNIKLENDPKVFILDFSDGINRFDFKKALNKQDLTFFIEDYKDGKLTAEMLSEEEPEGIPSSALVKVVAKTFNRIVKESEEDFVLLVMVDQDANSLIAAQLCLFISDDLRSNDVKVKFGKMTSNKNFVKELKMDQLPTIIFFNKEKDTQTEIEGNLTFDNIHEFLKDNLVGYHLSELGEESIRQTDAKIRSNLETGDYDKKETLEEIHRDEL